MHEKQLFFIGDTGGSKEKIRSTCAIVKTAFSQNNNFAPKAKIPVRSDPIRSGVRSGIRSGIRSNQESDPESDPGFVNGHYQSVCLFSGQTNHVTSDQKRQPKPPTREKSKP